MNRNIVTPFISLVFLVVALTGVLMFFHVFDGYTEVAHEIMAIIFVITTVFHVILNWKALKIHFKKRVFIPAAIVVAIISILFIVQQYNNPKFDTVLVDKIIQAPIEDVLNLLQVDSVEVVTRLKTSGIFFEAGETIEEIGMQNKVRPEKIVHLVME